MIRFPGPAARRRLRAQDRADALRWAVNAGRGRIAFETDPDIDDFVLIYEHEQAWASWGVSREGVGFSVWRTDGPGALGRFPTIRAALDAIPEPRRRAASGR